MRRLRFSTLAALVGASLAVLVASASPAGAVPVTDDFNRSNSTDLGPGWTETGSSLEIVGNQATNSANNNGFAQAVGGTGDTAAAKVTAASSGNAFNYAGVAVRVTDTSDMVMVRVQDNDGDGSFDHLIGTRGNGTGALIFNSALNVDFATARLTVRSDGVNVTAGVDTDVDDDFEVITTAPLPSEATGTGVGFGVANHAALDDFASSNTGQDTTTTVEASTNPTEVGEEVTFTATVTSTTGTPTGEVTFSVDGADQQPATLSGGQATYATTTLTEGDHTIVARYQPDTFDFHTSTSDSLTHTVELHEATSTELESSRNPSYENESVTFTATVSDETAGTPTGSVTFQEGSDEIGTVPLDGNGVAAINVALDEGTHLIGAYYTGDADFFPSDDTLNQIMLESPRPDARVRRVTQPILGNDVYNNTGESQTAAGSAPAGGTVAYRVSIQNDGTIPIDVDVRGQGSTNRFVVTYRTQGGANVTSDVVSGAYHVDGLAPGKMRILRVSVRTRSTTPHGIGITRSVTATSTDSPTVDDVVRFFTSRP